MAVVSARGDRDRCDAGESCEVDVALEALGTGCLADQDAHQLRYDPQHSLAGSDERMLEIVGEVTTVLDRPHDLVVELAGPAQRFKVALLI